MRNRVAFIVACAVACSGCLSSATLIRVKGDGSGTIEQTLLFNASSIDKAFSGMGLKSTGGSKSSGKSSTIKAEDLTKDLDRLGNGVSLVSVRPVKLPDGFEGAAVTFAFDDVSKLRTEDFLMPGPAAEGKKSGGGAMDGIQFVMDRRPDGTSILTARFQESTKGAGVEQSGKKSKDSPDLDDPEVRQMVKTLFKGFRIAVDLEVAGEIINTNADYVDGKRITLAEINIERLISESKKLEALDKVLSPEASIAKVRPHLKDIKGLKINHPVVTVQFRPSPGA